MLMALPDWWKYPNPWAIGDCVEIMISMPDNSVDLVVTSPPYDNLRTYEGFVFDFENVAKHLYRVTKIGGAVVWIVNDAVIHGSETGTSFKQALYFKEIGFNLHDTMIWHKVNPLPLNDNRYTASFEYMFIMCKGRLNTWNPIMEQSKLAGKKSGGTQIKANGERVEKWGNGKRYNDQKVKHNVWNTNVGGGTSNHPAVFPVELVIDHINSWSNAGDIVFDPFLGSGTTLLACRKTNRIGLGCEISPQYEAVIRERSLSNVPKLDEW